MASEETDWSDWPELDFRVSERRDGEVPEFDPGSRKTILLEEEAISGEKEKDEEEVKLRKKDKNRKELTGRSAGSGRRR